MLVLLLSITRALALPDPLQLRADWRADQALRGPLLREPFELDEAELVSLAEGGIVRRRDRLDGADRAFGAVWSPLSQEELWVAILDDACHTLVRGLTERHLPTSTPGQKLLYQHIRLPWPLASRQWVIDIRNNGELHRQSEGRIWERTWTLAEGVEEALDGLRAEGLPDPEAVWTLKNQGGWVLARGGGGTVVVYHGRADIGGAVPVELSTRYALATLEELLRGVLDRAASTRGHYRPGHVPMLGPDGHPIVPWVGQ